MHEARAYSGKAELPICTDRAPMLGENPDPRGSRDGAIAAHNRPFE